MAIRGIDTRFDLLPLPNLVLAAFLWLGGNLFTVLSLRKAEASEYGVLFTTRVIWTVLVATIFLDEKLSIGVVFGTVLLFLSSVLAVWEKKPNFKDSGFILSLITALFYGLAIANDGIILSKGFDIYTYFVYDFLAPAILIALFVPRAIPAAKTILLTKSINTKIIIISVLYALSAVGLFVAYQLSKNLSVLSALNQTQTVLVVIGAMVFLRERKYFKRRLLAAIVAVSGVLFIIL